MKRTFKMANVIQRKVIGNGLVILTPNWLASPNRWAVRMNGERISAEELKSLAWVSSVVKKSDMEFDILFPRQSEKFVITPFMADGLQGVIQRVFVGADGSGIVLFPNAIVQELGVTELWGFGTSQPYVNAANQSDVTAIIYPDPNEVEFPQVTAENPLPKNATTTTTETTTANTETEIEEEEIEEEEEETDWEEEEESFDVLEDLEEKLLQ